jgi:RNA polymerase sigma-70 factor (ECF subfamily)
MATGEGWREANSDGDDDLRLMARAQADLLEFARIYDKYVAVIYGYCRRRLDTDALAEDVTSAIFMKALAATPNFKPGAAAGTVRSWLFAIAHNAVLDQIKTINRRADRPLEDAAEAIDASPSPEAVALTSETKREMETAMHWLTDEQRRVIELRLAGLTGPEIAATLGIGHGAVRSLQRRALMRLRGAMCGSGKEAFR